ncbi:MAG: hypothetical protein SPH18_07845 [Sutterella parvirubra]|nr:hypothetical protein [Sutterella parvirubra]
MTQPDLRVDVEVDGRRFTVDYRVVFCEWTGDIQWNANVYEHKPERTELYMHCDGTGDDPFTAEDAEDLVRHCIRITEPVFVVFTDREVPLKSA